MNPELIAEALFDRVAEVAPVRHATRSRVALEALPELPACLVGFVIGDVKSSHNHPPEWTLNFFVEFIARSDGSETSPESLLNEWLVNLQAAMEPDDGERVLTLGGVCEHAWISGPVVWFPPDLGDPNMVARVTVEVLALG